MCVYPAFALFASASKRATSTKITLPLKCEPPANAAAFLFKDQQVITAAHCVRTAAKIYVAGESANIADSNSTVDLAILKLSKPLDHRPVAELASIPVFGELCTIQSPFPRQKAARLHLTAVPFELVKATGACIPLLELTPVKGTGKVGPGWSGAPVLSSDGRVIGIVTQIRGDVVHAVPSDYLTLLGEGKDLPLSYVPGLTLQPLTSEPGRRAARVDDSVTGVRVAAVSTDSPIRVGDVILEADGKKVTNAGGVAMNSIYATWQSAICRYAPGTSVPLLLLRDGNIVTETVKVRDSRDATAAQAWMDGQIVVAGKMMFIALSFELLQKWGNDWVRGAPQDLVMAAMREKEEGQKEIPILAGKAASEEEQFRDMMTKWGLDEDGEELDEVERLQQPLEDWEPFEFLRVAKVNGERVNGLADLARKERDGEEIIIEFSNGFLAAVPNGEIFDGSHEQFRGLVQESE